MRVSHVVVALLVCSSVTFGQRTIAKQKVKIPEKPKQVWVWVATPDAPEEVKAWVAKFPEIKREALDRIEAQLQHERQILASMKRRKAGRVGYTDTLGHSRTRLNRGEALRLRREWLAKEKEIKAMEVEKRKAEEDPLFVPFPELKFEIGSVGRPGSVFVFEVVNAESAIIQIGDKHVWLEGIDASALVDETEAKVDTAIIIFGTKQYGTALGGQRTIHIAKPFEWEQYVEKKLIDREDVPAARIARKKGDNVIRALPKKKAGGEPKQPEQKKQKQALFD